MAALFYALKRTYTGISPPTVAKSSDALRFGILGAANIAPQALIVPAKCHAEVIIAAVAARDPKRAEAYAQKHGIPIVHKTYDDLIADPSLDCIYVPLPINLHYEWTLKALKAGKHVLLEKPSVSNAEEARSLFHHPLLQKPDAPVLMEAFHYRFHPAWQLFQTLYDPEDVEHVEVRNALMAGVFSYNDIRFHYNLSGGALMDYGCYCISSIRSTFHAEPTSVTSATYTPLPEGLDKNIDEAMIATYTFPNGGTGKIDVNFFTRGGYWFPALTKNWPTLWFGLPKLTLKLKEKDGKKKEIIFCNYLAPFLYHRIDIITTDATGKSSVEYKKAYNWATSEEGYKGEDWWTTYRFQLEAFVDRVKKRKGTGVWVEPEDSIQQMEMIDATYLKSGLPLRPTSQALE